ncbi:MAG: hypothetical protein ACREFL_04050 [Stellaceae bacterium]
MPVLRAALGGLGLLALVQAAWMVHLRAPGAVVFWLCVIGAVLVFAALVERVTYKKLAPRKPPPDFAPSAERFIDPATGKLVQVYVKPATGERVYVDLGAAPPDRMNHSR